MPAFWNQLSPMHRKLLVVAVAAALLIGAALWWRPWRQADPRLNTPEIAVRQLAAKNLYFNAPARPWLASFRPELLTAEDRDPQSERARSFNQAVADAKLFRTLDRKYRFETLLLVGDPSQYRTLLDHLIETKDFTLSYADHTSLVYTRGGAVWTPAALEPLRKAFAGSKNELAQVLALTGIKLVSAKKETEGKALLEEAGRLDSGLPDVWHGLALYDLERGQLTDALALAEKALKLDAKHLGALAVKTQVYFAAKRFSEAYDLSKQLLERLPEDPNMLFKHAQIAHEAKAYKGEIEALEKLIALAEAEKRPTTGYHLYLAQAYTAAGQGGPAIEHYSKVLADPEAPKEQREFSQDAIERIKSRTGL